MNNITHVDQKNCSPDADKEVRNSLAALLLQEGRSFRCVGSFYTLPASIADVTTFAHSHERGNPHQAAIDSDEILKVQSLHSTRDARDMEEQQKPPSNCKTVAISSLHSYRFTLHPKRSL